MGAIGIINRFSKLKDVSFERTDGSPVVDLDSPVYYTSASRLFMGPVSGGGGAGSFSLGVSTGGNTLGLTGVTGTRVVLVGGGEITLSQSRDANGATITASAPPQSVQTQNRFNLTLAGNTAGVLQEVSSGTLTLAGGANVTLSQNGNAITISAGGGAETQTFVAGVGNSETTYTSGTVRLSELGAVTIRSTTGQQLQISVNPQSVQPETQTFVAGIAASDTTYSSGTVSMVGSGIITVQSGTGQRVIINASQSVQPETQTFIAGLAASDTTYSSGTVRITGVGGGVTVSSNTGQRIDISVAAPVAQTGTQFSGGISGGNTSGDTGTVAGRLVLAGGNNITLSGSVNGASETITISGPNTLPSFSAGVSNLGNTVGDTGVTGTRLVLVGGQSVTLSQATNANGNTITISGASTSQSVQTQNMVAVTLSGNTSGAQALISSGTMTLAGGNNITVSQVGNAVTISGPNAGGAQTGISGIANSETTYTSGSVTFSALGAITIRSTTGQHFQLSVNSQTVESQSIGMSNLGNTSGTTGIASGAQVRFLIVGGNNITLSQSLNGASGTLTISAFTQTVQTQNLHNVTLSGNTAGAMAHISSGTLTLAGGNNITLSQAGNAVTISGPNTVAQTNQSLGMYALGNTTGQSSSTTMDARTISIRGDGIISVGYSGGSLRISASQSVQPETQTFLGALVASDKTYTSGTITITGVGGGVTVQSNAGQRIDLSVAAPVAQTNQSLGMYAVQNTTGQSSSTTMDARTISVAGDGAVSVGYSAGSLRISAPTQTVQTQNLHNVTLSGNTAGVMAHISSGTMTLAGGNNITLSQNGNAVTISGGAGGAFSAGVSNIGNTLGDTGVSGSRMVLAGIGEVTLSQSTNANGNTVSISAPAQTVQSLGMYALGNTTGQSSSTTMDARTLSIRGDGIVSLGYSNGSLRISASQSVQPETQTFLGALVASDKTYTSGTITITGAGGGITVQSNAGQRIDLSVAAPVAQTNQSLGMYAVQNTTGQSSSTTMDARTLSVAGDGAVSVGYSAGSLRISAPVQSVQTQNLHNVTLSGNTAGAMAHISSGTMTLAGGNNITLSQAGNAVTISGGAGGGFSAGASNLGNTAGDTGVTGTRLVLVGTNNISLSQTTGAAGATLSFSGQPSFSGGVSNVGNTAGDTGVSGTRMVLVGTNNISLSQATNANGNTVSISGNPSFSAGLSNLGNTQGDTGVTGTRLVIVGSDNITISQATAAAGATISIKGQSPAGGAFSGGASNLGNTAGATGITGTQLVLVGSGVMSLSQTTGANGGTVSILAPAASVISAVAPLSTSTNGSTISILGPATSSLVGGGNITISSNGSTITIADSLTPLSFWDNMVPGASTTFQLSDAGLQIFPLNPANAGFPGYMSASSIFFDMSGTVSTAASFTRSLSLGFYTLVNSTQLSLLYSASTSWGTNAANMLVNESMGGRRWVTLHSSQFNAAPNFHEGSDYFMALWHRSSSGSQTFNFLGMLLPYATGVRSGFMSVASATNTTLGHYPFLGVYSISFTTGMPSALAASDINKSVATAISLPRIIFNNIGSNIL